MSSDAQSTFDTALKSFRTREDAAREALEALARERKSLPRYAVRPDYRFQSADGEKSLADLFNGQPQLVLYHFMFGPDWEQGCPFCTGFMNGLANAAPMHQHDTEFAFVSRAPVDKLEDWKRQHGWSTPWYSCETSFADEMGALPDGKDFSTINVFVNDGGTVYRTYFAGGLDSATDSIDWQRAILNLTPRGADPE